MSDYVANDFEAIRRYMEEQKAERDLALTGSTLPEPAKETKTESHMYGAYGDYVGWAYSEGKIWRLETDGSVTWTQYA